MGHLAAPDRGVEARPADDSTQQRERLFAVIAAGASPCFICCCIWTHLSRLKRASMPEAAGSRERPSRSGPHGPRSPVSRAVRELRQAYGESQQAFAYRTKTAIRTIARYETVRPPRGAELHQFLELAIAKQRHDLAEIFAKALGDELKMKAERIPRTIEEGLLADLLFLSARNRQIPEIAKRFKRVRGLLIENFRLLAAKLRAGEQVYGMDAEDLEILEAEFGSQSGKAESKRRREAK